jgi:hypothetical protein
MFLGEIMEKINPPYKDLTDEKKKELGYLTCKRVAILIRRYDKIRQIFNFGRMEEAFQWFDKESLLNFFSDLYSKYEYSYSLGNYDAEMYSLADFLTYFINYSPELFSQIVTERIKQVSTSKEEVKTLNEIFIQLGYFYKDGFFYSSSFNPAERAKVNDFLGEKLKEINEDLYQTWISLPNELLSNNPDKSTNISAKSRKLINDLLIELTPKLNFDKGEPNKIKKRLLQIFGEKSKSVEIIDKVSNLITILNESQAKGDHNFIDEETAIFTSQITELIVFFILGHKK